MKNKTKNQTNREQKTFVAVTNKPLLMELFNRALNNEYEFHLFNLFFFCLIASSERDYEIIIYRPF